MRHLALFAACAIAAGALLAGCGDQGSGCNARMQACGQPSRPVGGVSDTSQSYEDKQTFDYLNNKAKFSDQQQRDYEENLRQEGYQQGYDQGYQDGQDSSPKRDDDNSGRSNQWYYNVPSKVLDDGPSPGSR